MAAHSVTVDLCLSELFCPFPSPIVTYRVRTCITAMAWFYAHTLCLLPRALIHDSSNFFPVTRSLSSPSCLHHPPLTQRPDILMPRLAMVFLVFVSFYSANITCRSSCVLGRQSNKLRRTDVSALHGPILWRHPAHTEVNKGCHKHMHTLHPSVLIDQHTNPLRRVLTLAR